MSAEERNKSSENTDTIESSIGEIRVELGSAIEQKKLPESNQQFAKMMETKLEGLIGALTECDEKKTLEDELDKVHGIMGFGGQESNEREDLENIYKVFQGILENIKENENLIDDNHILPKYKDNKLQFIENMIAHIRNIHDNFEQKISQPE